MAEDQDEGGLVDMGRTLDEGDEGDATEQPKLKKPTYKFGHRISLDHDDMDKLGMDEAPRIGQKVRVHGHGEITSVHSAEETDEKGVKHKRHHVEIQLKKLKVAHHKEDGALKAVSDGINEAGE